MNSTRRRPASPVRLFFAHVVLLAAVSTGSAQPGPLSPSTPAPTAQPPASQSSSQVATGSGNPLVLTLGSAIERALKQNLSLVLEEQRSRTATAGTLKSRSDLLPTVTGRISELRQRVNLAAFGFTGFPGVPSLVGPFDVFDARVSVSQPIFDLKALYGARAAAASQRAAAQGVDDARDVVVAVVSTLYVQTLAAESRMTSLQAQKATADALLQLARDRKSAGLVAGIDVLRAELQVQREQQRLIEGQNAVDKSKLQLARAIGLDMTQAVVLADGLPSAPPAPLSVDDAMRQAMGTRADLRAAVARLDAAEAGRRAARGESLPTFVVTGDFGSIGSTLSTARGTYAIAGNVRVPLFEGTKARGRVLEADATLAARRAELEDARHRVAFEVRSALLDAEAARAALRVAETAVTLAEQQVVQARDRFAAGVGDTLEVTQAQEALAMANDSRIVSLSSLLSSHVALARAVGISAEESGRLFLERK